ncbi:MAG: transposase [Candidatus Binatia bacterium]
MTNQTSQQARRYTPRVKWQAVVAVIAGEEPATVAKRHNAHPTSVNAWKKYADEHGPELFATDTSVRHAEKKVQQLELLLGKKEVEIAFLKNWLDIAD